MTMSFSHGSAKIIPFPARVRTVVAGHRNDATFAADQAALRVSRNVSSSGWYHDAAIEESNSDHEH